jgi:hypothetical protein
MQVTHEGNEVVRIGVSWGNLVPPAENAQPRRLEGIEKEAKFVQQTTKSLQ